MAYRRSKKRGRRSVSRRSTRRRRTVSRRRTARPTRIGIRM